MGSVGAWQPLPEWLRSRRVENPKPLKAKSDEKCFAWCILRGLYPLPRGTVRSTSTTTGDLVDKVDEILLPPGVNYPIPMDNEILFKIQEMNEFTFSVFELGKTKQHVKPVYISPLKGRRPFHFLLGLLRGKESNHFVLLGEANDHPLAKVMPYGKGGHQKWYYCEGCLHGSKTALALQNHEADCGLVNRVGMLGFMGKTEGNALLERERMQMPRESKKCLEFKKWQNRLKAPFVVYADIEALLVHAGTEGDQFTEHKPCCWVYHIECDYEMHKKLKHRYV